jgi:hypothetical protein
MSTIVTCQCGVKLELPEADGDFLFRCPNCKTEIVGGVGTEVPSSYRAGAGVQATCPICQTAIAPQESVLTCPKCQQVHHRECWIEVGGCSTYGCEQAPALAKEETAPVPARTAWGDTKRCPACGERIKSIALRCRYCRTEFDTIDPLTPADLRRRAHVTGELKNLQTTTIVLFCITLVVGCLAPVMFVVSMCIVLPKRRLLARAGPFYLVLGYSTIGLSVLYSVLLLLFGLASLARH